MDSVGQSVEQVLAHREEIATASHAYKRKLRKRQAQEERLEGDNFAREARYLISFVYSTLLTLRFAFSEKHDDVLLHTTQKDLDRDGGGTGNMARG